VRRRILAAAGGDRRVLADRGVEDGEKETGGFRGLT
jgi:hypothetical protein